MWNLPAPPGFQGLRDDLPLEIYVQQLPHWRQKGATYFVTYRQCDSLPQAKLAELRSFKREWERMHPAPHSPEQLPLYNDHAGSKCWGKSSRLAFAGRRLIKTSRFYSAPPCSAINSARC